MAHRPQVQTARGEGDAELGMRVDDGEHVGPRPDELGVDRPLLVPARPALEPVAVEVDADEMLLAHLVVSRPDLDIIGADRVRAREAGAHVAVDVVGVTLPGEDAAREDELALQRALVGDRSIDDVGERLRHRA